MVGGIYMALSLMVFMSKSSFSVVSSLGTVHAREMLDGRLPGAARSSVMLVVVSLRRRGPAQRLYSLTEV